MNPAIIPNKNHWYASIFIPRGSETTLALGARLLQIGLVAAMVSSDLAVERQ